MAQKRPSVPHVNMGSTQTLKIMWKNAIAASNAILVSYTGIHAALVLEAQSKKHRTTIQAISNRNTTI